MKIKKGMEAEYQKYVESSAKDQYSQGVIDYLERWADLMEGQMEQGNKLQSIAKRTERLADLDGITGAQYGFAVHALGEFWEHGEELRQWHNAQYGYRGNGTINPALIKLEKIEEGEGMNENEAGGMQMQ